MKIGVSIDPTAEEIEVQITAEERNKTVNEIVDLLSDYDKKKLTTLTAYKGDRAYLIEICDIIRIYAANQKVYIQTAQEEFVVKYRLYELENLLNKKQFLRISNSEIVNIKKIQNIDLSLVGVICIHFSEKNRTFVSRRYIPKIKKSLGI